MILGLGTDIVSNKRIERLFVQYSHKFLQKIYTSDEINYAMEHSNPVPYLAARFAAKEALVKSLNIQGRSGLSLNDVEVYGKNFGKKKIRLTGKIKIIADKMGAEKIHLSISHAKDFSMAVVILESL